MRQAVEPISTALSRLSREGGEDENNSKDCEEGRGASDARRLSVGSAIDAAPAAPRGARAKAAEHILSDVKRHAQGSCSSFASQPCLNQLRIVGNAGLPCTKWLCPYDFRQNLKSDLIAGCTVGVMVIPQSISYASLAGLDPIYGLYSALLPAFTCKHGSPNSDHAPIEPLCCPSVTSDSHVQCELL